jgi:hypothetical protein
VRFEVNCHVGAAVRKRGPTGLRQLQGDWEMRAVEELCVGYPHSEPKLNLVIKVLNLGSCSGKQALSVRQKGNEDCSGYWVVASELAKA